MNSILLLLFSVTLALMLIVTALLVCSIRKKCCRFCKDKSVSEFAGRNAEAVCGPQQNQQRNEDTLVYSTPVFTQQKADRAGRVKTRRKEETIYSYARAFDKD
ncbi:hypothetical protein ILYODFUR_022113 [Ilyodon furcidens]|uniref:Uncharacterized protein n=1 Tax=Ilyodon furcidens TaxID=33524 RepID=A0ABV0UVL3_9TELE